MALYGAPGLVGNAQARTCTAARPTAERLKPLVTGQIAAIQTPAQPKPLPPLSFQGPDGKTLSLDDFRGRTVLLNLWATWCAPCRHEMPALDTVQAQLGGTDFEVVAVAIDTRNPERARGWLADNKVEKLAFYADPSAKIFQDLKGAGKAFGMPTTLLIDPNGCELGYLAGPAEWASPEALIYLKAALGR